MAHKVIFTSEAESQLQDLENYLADRFYPSSAEQYMKRLIAACHSLAMTPHRGTKRDDLAPGIRMTGFERRVTIYFKVVDDEVLIIGIFYGGQSFKLSESS